MGGRGWGVVGRGGTPPRPRHPPTHQEKGHGGGEGGSGREGAGEGVGCEEVCVEGGEDKAQIKKLSMAQHGGGGQEGLCLYD